jgi:hypothetical protein
MALPLENGTGNALKKWALLYSWFYQTARKMLKTTP